MDAQDNLFVRSGKYSTAYKIIILVVQENIFSRVRKNFIADARLVSFLQ